MNLLPFLLGKLYMGKLHFTIEEYCITDDYLPPVIAQKILEHHIVPMSKVRHFYGGPIAVSKKSGYRPPNYEKERGRRVDGVHTFIGGGAADYTVQQPTYENLMKLVRLIEKHTNYKRVCLYPNNGFIHADYNAPEKQFFTAESPVSRWSYEGRLEDA